jgi:hypothetical protein
VWNGQKCFLYQLYPVLLFSSLIIIIECLSHPYNEPILYTLDLLVVKHGYRMLVREYTLLSVTSTNHHEEAQML